MGTTHTYKNRTIGKGVHLNNQEVLHITHFSNVNGNLCGHDERTRFAYLVVSKAQARKVAGSLEDDETVLHALVDNYTSYLLQGVDAEQKEVAKDLKLKPREIPVKDKLIYLASCDGSVATNLWATLYGKKFHAAAKTLDASDKEKKEPQYVGSLKKTITQCKADLLHEYDKLPTKDLDEDDKHPYALISMPYVYNVSKRGAYGAVEEYAYTTYEENVQASLTPIVRVEYGVFFDGTNNNMYNINFYQNYKKYLSGIVKEIHDANVKLGDTAQSRDLKDYDSFAKFIAYHPDPQKTPQIMNMLRDEMIGDIGKIRYFEPSSTKLRNYGNDNASNDANKTFDFLLEIRKNFTHSESWLEEKYKQGRESVNSVLNAINKDEEIETLYLTGTTKDIYDFLREKILPEADEAGSYVNGYTNIKRLYEHYKGTDRLNPDAHKYDVRRFKLYASGSGTVDPIEEEELESNSYIGLGLGEGFTGVKAHVVYTCKKIAQQLREAGIEYVDELVLDVFGFSRGATEARHFVCSIQKEFELLKKDETHFPYTLNIAQNEKRNIFTPFFEGEDGLYTDIGTTRYYNPLKKIPLSVSPQIRKKFENNPPLHIENVSFRHVNIGDTVTHHGIMQSNDFKELNIKFDPKKVGSVYHLMAMDEYRYQFDAFSIFDDDYDDKQVYREEENLSEFIVPGAHADVGGGYETHNGIEKIILDWELLKSESKIKAWDRAYEWLGEQYNTVSKVSSLSEMKQPGFYQYDMPITIEAPIIFNKLNVRVADVPINRYYMHRTNLTWLYELVTLQLMYNATQNTKEEKDKVPLEELEEKYTMANMKKRHEDDHKFLQPVLKTLEANKAIDIKTHRALRQRYVHHSIKANLMDIANIPDYIGTIPRGELYARRSIYGASGEKFKVLPTLASKFAGYYKPLQQ